MFKVFANGIKVPHVQEEIHIDCKNIHSLIPRNDDVFIAYLFPFIAIVGNKFLPICFIILQNYY